MHRRCGKRYAGAACRGSSQEPDVDMMPPVDLTEKFEINWASTIGEGAFSVVRECTGARDVCDTARAPSADCVTRDARCAMQRLPPAKSLPRS